MARRSLLSRLRGRGSMRTAPRRSLPSPGVLRRERRLLVKVREQRLRDLGGLLIEMYRRDRFREELLRERCAELMDIETRLYEVEALLAGTRHRPPGGRCSCGAPLLLGSRFCANCGRPAGEPAVVACSVCGHALAADARFCSACGTLAATLGEGSQADGERSAPAPKQSGR